MGAPAQRVHLAKQSINAAHDRRNLQRDRSRSSGREVCPLECASSQDSLQVKRVLLAYPLRYGIEFRFY